MLKKNRKEILVTVPIAPHYLFRFRSDHFVLNVASVSIEFAPDCSCIVRCTHFIHCSISLTSSEYDISSDGALS
ncbi:hypothetical protein T07_9626 [Trichinella nelsoni]|uniref:Uncharacterized protein n=1 Tax=Trichinella nelsoni TaxID=6336 RepID=A0A0V0S5P7_9BILA|nr:hypothetical protein T07_9626 [Trichinella nelsoni]